MSSGSVESTTDDDGGIVGPTERLPRYLSRRGVLNNDNDDNNNNNNDNNGDNDDAQEYPDMLLDLLGECGNDNSNDGTCGMSMEQSQCAQDPNLLPGDSDLVGFNNTSASFSQSTQDSQNVEGEDVWIPPAITKEIAANQEQWCTDGSFCFELLEEDSSIPAAIATGPLLSHLGSQTLDVTNREIVSVSPSSNSSGEPVVTAMELQQSYLRDNTDTHTDIVIGSQSSAVIALNSFAVKPNVRKTSDSKFHFPMKLRQLLEDCSRSVKDRAVIGWTRSGDGFYVNDFDALTQRILPKHYRGKSSAFGENLSSYGFQRITTVTSGQSQGACYHEKDTNKEEKVVVTYSHPQFRRYNVDAIEQMSAMSKREKAHDSQASMDLDTKNPNQEIIIQSSLAPGAFQEAPKGDQGAISSTQPKNIDNIVLPIDQQQGNNSRKIIESSRNVEDMLGNDDIDHFDAPTGRPATFNSPFPVLRPYGYESSSGEEFVEGILKPGNLRQKSSSWSQQQSSQYAAHSSATTSSRVKKIVPSTVSSHVSSAAHLLPAGSQSSSVEMYSDPSMWKSSSIKESAPKRGSAANATAHFLAHHIPETDWMLCKQELNNTLSSDDPQCRIKRWLSDLLSNGKFKPFTLR